MVISNAIVCDIHGERLVDVRITEGMITEMGSSLNDDEMIDGSGCYLLPGLFDSNVSLKDLQLSGKHMESLSREAMRGGVSHLVLSGEISPKVDNEITLEFVKKHREHPQGALIECAISALNDAGALSNIAILLKNGGAALYTKSLHDYNLIMRIAQYLQMSDKPLFYFAQDRSLFESGVMSDGAVAASLGLPGISPIAEVAHIASMIEVARQYGISIVFKSVTEPRSIRLIAQARAEGVNVECEVSIHHLIRSDEACRGYDTDAKINPPLVSEAKREVLLGALKAGDINSLSALHQPNSDVQKDITFYDAAYGTTSIGEYLPLIYTYLVKTEILSMSDAVKLASFVPARQLKMRGGEIRVGERMNAILFNPSVQTHVTHHHSLYKNEVLEGKVTLAVQGESVIRF